MKLVHSDINNQFDFEKSNCYLLVMENSKFFLQIIKELYDEVENNKESNFTLSHNYETLTLNKNALFLYDFLNIDFNNKKIVSEINSKVLKMLTQGDFSIELNQINQNIIKINDEVLQNFDFKIEYDDDFSFDKLIKFSSYKVSGETSFLEQICAYIKIFAELKNIKLVFFMNAMQVLTQDQLQLLLQQLEYMEIKCILLESFEKYKLGIPTTIIDDDLCEI